MLIGHSNYWVIDTLLSVLRRMYFNRITKFLAPKPWTGITEQLFIGILFIEKDYLIMGKFFFCCYDFYFIILRIICLYSVTPVCFGYRCDYFVFHILDVIASNEYICPIGEIKPGYVGMLIAQTTKRCIKLTTKRWKNVCILFTMGRSRVFF